MLLMIKTAEDKKENESKPNDGVSHDNREQYHYQVKCIQMILIDLIHFYQQH